MAGFSSGMEELEFEERNKFCFLFFIFNSGDGMEDKEYILNPIRP